MLDRRALLLRLLEISTEREALDRCLAALAEGIRGACECIKTAHSEGPGDYAQAITDSECDMIEALLGSAFVACQKYITGVVSRTLRLAQAGVPVTDDQPLDRVVITRHGAPLVAGTDCSGVECIDAVANYFKHEDEWRGDWSDPGRPVPGRSRRTVDIILSMGLQRGSTGNLRTAAEKLGNCQYSDLAKFSDVLVSWRDAIVAAARRRLLGL